MMILEVVVVLVAGRSLMLLAVPVLRVIVLVWLDKVALGRATPKRKHLSLFSRIG